MMVIDEEIVQVITIHPEGNVNVCSKFHVSPLSGKTAKIEALPTSIHTQVLWWRAPDLQQR